MILALTLILGATAGLCLCWLSARRDDHKPVVRVLPPPTHQSWPNEGRACRRAVNQ